MRTVVIQGGWYAENVPTGEYACLVPGSHIETHRGRIELPKAEQGAGGLGPLYLRIQAHARRGFQIAGQSHGILNVTWLWDGTAWLRFDGPVVGVSPVIFDHEGTLRISDGSVGSQGYRYVEDGTGRLVSGDETYADPARIIGEYTTHGDLTIGQSGFNAVALYAGHRYVLETGDSQFIRFNRSGDQLAVTIHKPAERRTVCSWLTVAELPTFPEQVITTTPPPQPPPMDTPNRLDVVEAVHAAYPHLLGLNTDAACGEFTERLAIRFAEVDPHFGLVSKQPGEHQYRGHGVDSIKHKITGQVIDIAASGGGGSPTKPQWLLVPSRIGNDWMAPIPVDGSTPAPPPNPTPPPVHGPSLHDWITKEMPQLEAEYVRKRGSTPSFTDGAFQTYRRCVDGWPFDRVFKEV